MLVPVFTLRFSHKVIPRLLTVGNYDGTRPCLTGATTGGKIFVHNPDSRRSDVGGSRGRVEQLSSQGDVSLLNINQVIACLAAGRLKPDSQSDTLVVGMQTNLLGYDVANNHDLFYKEMSDGANAVVIGQLGTIASPLAIIGGNCSIQGFDAAGDDLYWTVTGDNVCSLALVDFYDDGKNELVVGSEDYDIRVFREDEIIAEMTETEVITSLCPIEGRHFGYALGNGTVGVYGKNIRLWRIKSKNIPFAVHAYDLNGDGVKELVTGWSNGKVDARNCVNGEIIFKDNFSQAIAGIAEADYRQDGNQLLICCSVDGEVRGFSTADTDVRGNLMDVNADQETLRELSQKKQNLLMELKNYEENYKAGQVDRPSWHGTFDRQQMGVIPANTQIQTSLYVASEADAGKSTSRPGVEVCVKTTNDTVIRSVVIFAEGIFDGESYCVHPAATSISNCVKVRFAPPKDIPVELYIKVFVGYRNSIQYHVFETSRSLPRFSMYSLLDGTGDHGIPEPQGYVTFTVKERVNRVVMWLNQNFLMVDEYQTESSLDVSFLCLRSLPSPQLLHITMDRNGEVCIQTDDMELAGDIVQELCDFLNITELSSTADFPLEFDILQAVLIMVQELQSTRQKLSSDMADHSNIIRALVVKSEDSRAMGDVHGMRQGYLQLYNLNHDLINGYYIRCNNHQKLLECLKQVNQVIQRAGQLRFGKYKTQVVSACREAVKNNSLSVLVKTIKTGSS